MSKAERFFCSKHNLIITKEESLHHKDGGCNVSPYFGMSETEFHPWKDMNHRASFIAWYEREENNEKPHSLD